MGAKTAAPQLSSKPSAVSCAKIASQPSQSRLPAVALQQGIGNAATMRLLRQPIIEPKLTVSHPEDESEREADRIADQVMRMPEPQSSSTILQTQPAIQRACLKCEDELQRKPDFAKDTIPEEEEAGVLHEKLKSSPEATRITRKRREVALPRERAGGQAPQEDLPIQALAIGARASRSEQQAKRNVSQADHMRQVATKGVAGPATSLPHLDAIQRSFGNHDVSGVEAHTGPQATDSNHALDAVGYTIGNHVAFAGTPDLHTAAHEAAHVVQQRGGVQLSGGLGQAGDAYERHADAVADRVVKGKQAGPLLDQMSAPAGNHHASASRVEVMRRSADQPLQMQGAHKQTQKEQPKQTTVAAQPPGNIIMELNQQAFHNMLEKHRLMEEVNGAAAHALADAYLKTFSPATKIWTPYGLRDLDLRVKPSHEDAYEAILSVMDITKTGKGNNGADWKWAPAQPPKKETRKGTEEVLIGSAKDQALDYGVDEISEKAIKKGAIWCAARWSAAEGLVVTAKIVLGALSVIGWIALATSVLELLIVLQKPVEKQMSKQESIILQVNAWLHGKQMMAEAAQKTAREDEALKESRSKPLKFETTPAVRSTTRIGP